ncbi:hypothetical protein [Mariprofundus ferrooxydans]|uniref:hypothetical protein n=1 Tax=Mariprofundus ferrooxydans TaxID=314344 RepID=UPI00142F4CF9|nr:hypothetical protein [Mariprofundus ferrooxydans]
MKMINVRLPEELHATLFQISLKESAHLGKRVSMNEAVCDAVTFFIANYESDGSGGDADAGNAIDITATKTNRDTSVNGGSNHRSETFNADEAIRSADASVIDNMDNTIDAGGINRINDTTGIVDATDPVKTSNTIEINDTTGSGDTTDTLNSNDAGGTSITAFLRKALLNNEKIDIVDVADKFNCPKQSISSIKSRLKKAMAMNNTR